MRWESSNRTSELCNMECICGPLPPSVFSSESSENRCPNSVAENFHSVEMLKGFHYQVYLENVQLK